MPAVAPAKPAVLPPVREQNRLFSRVTLSVLPSLLLGLFKAPLGLDLGLDYDLGTKVEPCSFFSKCLFPPMEMNQGLDMWR